MMKSILKKIMSFIIAIILLIPTLNVYADEHIFTAKKSAVRITKAGEFVECIVSASERNFFSYKAQLVYDKEMFEFVNADPVYIQGEPEDIRYFSKLPDGMAYNVPNAQVYKNEETLCGYYGQESTPGIFRSISTIMGFEGRDEGDDILKITLKSKKTGDSFIYIMDEETAVLNEDKTVANNVVSTTLKVKTETADAGFVVITDVEDVAYPWRKNENAIFQMSGEILKNDDSELTGELYNVSYTNKDVSINVTPDGTIICSITMDKENEYCPIVARKGAFGDLKRINRVKYDINNKKLTFVIDEFGDYVIADTNYVLTDCEKNSEVYRAVRYLKSIDVIDGNATTFAPNNAITKAEFIKMLICCIGKADISALVWFKDVSLSDWYYKYIATAAKLGIITDDGGDFYPNAPLSSGDARKMLEKAAEITNGYKEVSFNDSGSLTRGNAAVAICDMLWAKLQ